MHEWRFVLLTLSVVMTALAVMLLVGGIQLLRRRAGALRVLNGWAVLKVVLIAANAIVTGMYNHEQFERMGQSPGAMSAQFSTGMTAVTLIFQVLWGLALPVFILIWLNLGKIKSESAQWR